MKSYIKNILQAAAFLFTLGFSSCTSDLDVTPIDPNKNTTVDNDALFNKCYANLALQGNGGASGDTDISGLDGGTTPFIRQMFNVNELPTDEAICAWGDEGISTYNYASWTASHPMVQGFYYRLYFGITICNHYLEIASDVDAQRTAEVRFLRALYYYYLMDTFGNVPFATTVSSDKPSQIKRADLYAWIESELLDIEGSLADAQPKTSSEDGYGRADKAADWLLLARLYLNAEVYTGTAQWDKAATYAKKVMDSSYKLYTTPSTDSHGDTWSAYQKLFMGDNGESGASVEAILPILYQGNETTSWGGTLFLIAGNFSGDGDMHPAKNQPTVGNGTDQNWGGNRARRDLVEKFFPSDDAPLVASYDMTAEASDDRALFWGLNRTEDVTTPATFGSGFSVTKFLNIKSDGSAGTDQSQPDADFFLMRTAEAYLTYAEATARQNSNKTTTEGTAAINTLRARANAAQKAGYSLNDILDEWSREFYFEGRRRIDLVRFGKFGGTTDYKWQWKGGTYAGRDFDAFRNIYAIPTNDLTANEKLTQNTGY
ncbi:MAG: RagB/SusD family nutrient uptake outer membrane protein [Prevotella sp.]|nr:RagB/SusD family nutrient uptake outer membrane protein [Prevotella sp.]